MRILVQDSSRKLEERQSGGRKRSKDTSGEVGVSPHTLRVRPQAKRPVPATPRRILFCTSSTAPLTGLLPKITMKDILILVRIYTNCS